MEHCLTTFSVLEFILTQYIASHASSFVFSIPMWLLSSFSISASAVKMYYYSLAFYNHTIYHGQLMPDGPISLYFLCHIFFSGKPFMMYAFRFGSCASLAVTSCISCVDVHTGRSTAVYCIAIYAETLYLYSLCGCIMIVNL